MLRTVMSINFPRANRELMQLETDPDPRAKACAVVLRVQLAEMYIAVEGLTPGRVEYREFYLNQMLGLGREYGKLGPEFANLEMEAHTRRVRHYFDAGRKLDAVGEARTAFAMLEKRRAHRTPTVDFVSGAFDAAVGHSSAPVRLLFRMAGITGDLQAGYKAIMRLVNGNSIYKYDAMYMAHHFAREPGDSPFGDHATWAHQLYKAFPSNPQFIFDIGDAWRTSGKCTSTLQVLTKPLEQIQADPTKWTNVIRAKLYWLAGRCAMDLGHRDQARQYAKKSRAEKFEMWHPILEKLEEDIEG